MNQSNCRSVSSQRGLVMVFALLVLLSMTVLGVASVSSGLMQNKMASSLERKSIAFDAAEAALAGVVFESEDESVLANAALSDPLSEARQLNPLDRTVDTLSCFDDNRINRVITANGLTSGTRHTNAGNYRNNPEVRSWSRTSFVREQACKGSSNVIGGSNINCHVFMIRGCGQAEGSNYAVANTLSASVFAPASGQ